MNSQSAVRLANLLHAVAEDELDGRQALQLINEVVGEALYGDFSGAISRAEEIGCS